MKNNEFQILKQYLGTKLISYTLNINSNIIAINNYDSICFSTKQKEVLETIFNTIKMFRIDFINNNGYGDFLNTHISLRLGGSIPFSEYRRYCDGIIPDSSSFSSDTLLQLLVNICIREYPYMIILSDLKHCNSIINIEYSEMVQFAELVKSDVIDKLSNKREDLEYNLSFETSNHLRINKQVVGLPHTIIKNSFEISCNRMKYDLEDVISEVKNSLETLRSLARKEEISYSTFIGIQGLSITQSTEINLSDSIILRQLKSPSNPGLLPTMISDSYTENSFLKCSGCILEIKHTTKIKNCNFNIFDMTMPSISSDITAKLQLETLNVVELAIVFALDLNRAMNNPVFQDCFPLLSPDNISFNKDKPLERVNISDTDIAEIKEWFSILNSSDKSKIKTTLSRLKLAIFERHSIEDSLIDSLIAWEGLFSGTPETKFKITASIANYINLEDNKKSFFDNLSRLYDARSAIVHGRKYKGSLTEDRKYAINVGLQCIKKILKDEKLLSLNAEQRVKELFINREFNNFDEK